MPSNDVASLQDRMRAQRYSHQGAAGSPNYDNSKDRTYSGSSTHTGNASNGSNEQDSRKEATKRASDLKYHQYDGSRDSGGSSQQADTDAMRYGCSQGNVTYESTEGSEGSTPYRYDDCGEANIVFCREDDIVTADRGNGDSIRADLRGGGHDDDANIHKTFPGYQSPTVEDDTHADALLGYGAHGEQGNSSNRPHRTAEERVKHLQANLNAIRSRQESGEARLNEYIENMADWRQKAKEEVESIEHIMRLDRAYIERRTAERAREEALLQAKWAEKDRLERQRSEEDGAVARHILRREEEDLRQRVSQRAQNCSQHPERPVSALLGDEGSVHHTRELTPTPFRSRKTSQHDQGVRKRQAAKQSTRLKRYENYRFIGPQCANGPDAMHNMAWQCCKCATFNTRSDGQPESRVPHCGDCSHPLCLDCGRQAGVWVVRVKVDANGKLLPAGSQCTV